RLDGRLIRQREAGGAGRVFLCHRSPGENLRQPTETADQRETVSGADVASTGVPPAGALVDRIPRRAGRRFLAVSPMRRSDGGLELVSSDGNLAAKLQRSMRHLESEFSIRVHGELSRQGLDRVLEGTIDNGERLKVERCEVAGGEGS